MKSRDEYINSIYVKKEIKAEENRKKHKSALSVCLPAAVCVVAAVILVPGFTKNRVELSKDSAFIESGTLISEENLLAAAADSIDGKSADEAQSEETNRSFTMNVVTPWTYAQAGGSADGPNGARPEAEEEGVTEIARETAPASSNKTQENNDTVMSAAAQESTQIATTVIFGTTSGYTAAASTTRNVIQPHTTTTVPGAQTAATLDNLSSISVEMSTGEGFSPSSEGMNDLYQAFSWTFGNIFYGKETVSKPDSTIYKLNFKFTNGVEKTVWWAQGALSHDGTTWYALSDSQNSQLSAALN